MAERSPYLADIAEDPGGFQSATEFDYPGLSMGEMGAPGDTYYSCGFPLGAKTPRLSKGIIGGYDHLNPPFGLPFNHRIHGPVLSGFINKGNSGGPVVNDQGQLMGTIVTKQIPQPKDVEEHGLLSRAAQTGMGFALDIRRIRQTVEISREVERNLEESDRDFFWRRHDPSAVKVEKQDFVRMQIQASEEGHAPNGPFSYDSGGIYAGKPGDPNRVEISSGTWSQLIEALPGKQGSFFLRGYRAFPSQNHSGDLSEPISLVWEDQHRGALSS